MKYTENAINILTAKSYKGIGNAWIIKNLKGNESIKTIVSLLIGKNVKPTVEEFEHKVEEFEYKRNQFKTKLAEKFEDVCDGLVALGDPNFPKHRGAVKDSERPVFLYYKGNIDLLSNEYKCVSVIGLLNPDEKIEERERAVVAELVKNRFVIVSGLAFGCDSISHKQALDSNGRTIAILPSPLDNILPTRNKGLAYKIVEEGGLLITEYGNDFKNIMELSSRYKERDRLQALFCDTIILAASYAQDTAKHWPHLKGQKLDCGARLAMAYAKDYNIPRAVMYDKTDSDNPMFDLNRQLINEQKSITVINSTNLNEVIGKISPKYPAVQKDLFS